MNVLVIGCGGREHAIIRKLKESARINKLYCAPGNGGISKDAVCVDISVTNSNQIIIFCKENQIDLVVVTPDDPLAAGMVDALEAAGIRAFGPRREAAAIESSKVFAKHLMKQYGIPTPDYEVFYHPDKALTYIKKRNQYPVVVKADGLALGKGVVIASDFTEAEHAVKAIMEDKIFGSSGNQIVVEAFIAGPEVSVLAFTDGKCIKPMVSSKDHKRVFDGDKGPNTGGMGTISPNPYYTDEIAEICMKTIFRPTINAMNQEGRRFKGCLYFGLMLTEKGPQVIEYNCRFGDPETQVVLPRLKTDLMDIFESVIDERLEEQQIEWADTACACVVMTSGGYPGKYETGMLLNGLDENGQLEETMVYHAGTRFQDSRFYSCGGRVLGITATGSTLEQALSKAYAGVEKLGFEGAYYRRDIGR